MSVENLDLLREINPAIESAYEEHMRFGSNRPTEPIDPIALLSQAAGVTEQDPAVYGPVLRASLATRLQQFRDQGIDAEPLLAATILMNLLTEDNLPHYSIANYQAAEHSPALTLWLNEWIAEEADHGTTMRDYGLATGIIGRFIKPADYHDGHVSQLRQGIEVSIAEFAQGMTYLALQEACTFRAHQSSGHLLDQPGRKIMRRIAGDEFKHSTFYAKLVTALVEVAPDHTLVAINQQFKNFDMPGRKGIPNFDELTRQIAISGLFDRLLIEEEKAKLVERWEIAERTPQTAAAKQAKAELKASLEPATRDKRARVGGMNHIRTKVVESAKQTGQLLPFILGHTVQIDPQSRELAVLMN